MDSPYQQYLDTNYGPAADEARQIESIVGKSAKEIADLDEHIDNLQQQLDILHEKRAKLREFSDRHKALLSPVRKLTRDVLEEIFLACFPINRNPCMSAREAPVLLTRICSWWRQIALSTPTLWAKIHIALPVIQIGQYADAEDIHLEKEKVLAILKLREIAIKDWLTRSHACPLSISIFKTYNWTSPELADITDPIFKKLQEVHVTFLNNTIIPHHKRWRDFDIYVTNDTLCGLLDVGLKAESLPMLETFHVSRQIESFSLDGDPYQWKDIVSLMSSRITSATLHSFPIRDSDIDSISPYAWGNLTELCLKLENDVTFSPSVTFRLAASILGHCHALVTLKLRICSHTTIHDTSDSELQHEEDCVVLQHLTTLTISLPLGPISLAFAKLLYLPSINEFGIEFNDIMQDADREQLPRDIIRSLLRHTESYRVMTITTPFWTWSSDILVQLLEVTPSVRSLTITTRSIRIDRWPISIPPQPSSRYVVNNSLLQALMPTNKSDSEIICPKLEVLILDSWDTGITETCLKEFVVARKSDERVPALRRICVYIDQPKQKQSFNTGNVSLGSDSIVYFRRLKEPTNFHYSPYEGFRNDFVNSTHAGDVPMEYYNEL